MSEQAPLLGASHGRNASNGGGTYYFNNSTGEVKESGKYQSVSDADGGQVVESLPSGASAKDFEPRAIGTGTKVRALVVKRIMPVSS